MLTFWQILVLLVVASVLALIVLTMKSCFEKVFIVCMIEDVMKAYGELMEKLTNKGIQNLKDIHKE